MASEEMAAELIILRRQVEQLQADQRSRATELSQALTDLAAANALLDQLRAMVDVGSAQADQCTNPDAFDRVTSAAFERIVKHLKRRK